MKKKLPTVIIALVFLAGLSFLLYPTVSDWWNSMHQSRIVSEYARAVDNMDSLRLRQLLKEAREYNSSLADKTSQSFTLTKEEKKIYNSLLNISGGGVMGYIEIPSIGVMLPVYHGTDNAVLSRGIGHLEGTSLPVGGKSTHSVISGHRGLPSAKLLTDLDKMEQGDVFYIHILGKTLTYKVDRILTVLPDETEELYIKQDKDLCTLVTCTPYGINSHRLLVRGHRSKTPSSAASPVLQEMTDPAIWKTLLVAAISAAVVLIVLILVIRRIKRRKKKDKKR